MKDKKISSVLGLLKGTKNITLTGRLINNNKRIITGGPPKVVNPEFIKRFMKWLDF